MIATTPLVSVVMPAFNAERHVAEAVDSIVHQTFADLEFIVIEDKSADNTLGVLKCISDPRLRLVRNRQNLGVIASLNRGVALARGRYIARMDADDVSSVDRLGRQVDFLDAHPDIGVVGSWVQVIDDCGNALQCLAYPTENACIKWWLHFHCPLAHPSVMLRRDLLLAAGGYDERERHVEDYDLWQRLSTGAGLANLPAVLLRYRQHGSNISTTHADEQDERSVRIMARAIAATLGPGASTDAIRYLRCGVSGDRRVIWRSAQLVLRLYEATVRSAGLPAHVRRWIRNDAARRLFKMASSGCQGRIHWQVLAAAVRLNPLLPFSVTRSAVASRVAFRHRLAR